MSITSSNTNLKQSNRFFRILFLCFLAFPTLVLAQEKTAPIFGGKVVQKDENLSQRPTNLTLPFFDDFSGNFAFPNPQLWQEQQVYISNTMSGRQPTAGVAVFDANNAQTIPYDSLIPDHQVLADTLTSQPIDLSNYQPNDNLWLSFDYQPGGNGFLPKPFDSLMLLLKNDQDKWIKIWGTAGYDTTQAYKKIMIPILDASYFHSQFCFRFVNKATHGISNSNWNLDYVYLNAQRNADDTALNDLAFTTPPANMLNDFTAMPFSHFQTQPSQFLNNQLGATLKNNGAQNGNLNLGLRSTDLISGHSFGNQTGNHTIQGYQKLPINFSNLSFSGFTPIDNKVIIQNKYFTSSLYANEPKINDTIVQTQVFDNYFAYDDGTAEQAYFLNLFPDAPGVTAIEMALYHPDTLRGAAIYFPRTVPPSGSKEFSLIVYKTIAIDGNQDQIIYQQDFFLPKFQDSVNKFSVYKFENPVPMEEGVYYLALMQSAGGFSDSLYIGLDVNRTGGNHRYFNVDGIWQPSTIDGAILFRPLVGGPLPATKISDVSSNNEDWLLYPNPGDKKLNLKIKKDSFNGFVQLTDVTGRILKTQKIDESETQINTQALLPGIYFITLTSETGQKSVRKWIKK